jgi:tripartite-type tricarboxylate transporter receptor subunit TctC
MTSKPSKPLAILIAVVVSAGFAGTAAAQSFPSKPVRLVHPFTAGSGAELSYRPLAEEVGAALGQNVIVEAKPGGGSLVASLHVKSQPADGYTIYAASNTAVVKSLVPDPQIDIRKDFTPIVYGFIAPMVISVNVEHVKATTLRQLIDEARANPGKLNYASYGIGSGAHMFFALLLNETKVNMVHVPFQGTAQAAADTVAGRTQVTGTLIGSIAAFLPGTGSGKLRALAVSTADASPLVAGVPGMKDAGFAEIDYPLWGGFVGPAGMPRDIVMKLNQAFNTAFKAPKSIENARRVGNVPIGGTPEDLARAIEREYNAYAKLIKDTGLKLE